MTKMTITRTTILSSIILLAGLLILAPAILHAQDDTTTQSNTDAEASVSAEYIDPDDDGDGVPQEEGSDESSSEGSLEVQQRANPTGSQDGIDSDIEAGVSATKEIDKASPKLYNTTTKEIDKATPKLYDGISTQVCDDTGDCDDADGEVSPQGLEVANQVRVNVDAQTVRGLNEEEKSDILERFQDINAVNNANDFGMYIASQALQNESITNVSAEEGKAEVRYDTEIRILGLFPARVEAVGEADAEGRVKVKYPWFGFLSTKTDNQTIRTITQNIFQARAQMDISVEEEGAPINIREES